MIKKNGITVPFYVEYAIKSNLREVAVGVRRVHHSDNLIIQLIAVRSAAYGRAVIAPLAVVAAAPLRCA